MITSVRTANINDGKMADATAFAVEVAAYVTENLGLNLQVMRNVGGPVAQLHWVANYESLGALEASMAKIIADDGYQELLAGSQAKGLFAASSIVDNIYASVP